MTTTKRRRLAMAAGGTTLLLGGVLVAQPMGEAPEHRGKHVMVTEKDLEWKEGPGSLASGAEMVVLEGDPSKRGPFTMRLKLPSGFEIAPHHHPAIEHVTVLSGTFHMAEGERFDREKGKELPAGSFAVMPIGMRHYAWASEETVVQLHGMGPWDIIYVNPEDDPRNSG